MNVFQFYFKCNAILRLQIMSMLNYKCVITSRILHWLIHVVDNFNVKTNLICKESPFQQTNMAKTQMHFLYVRTGEFRPKGFFLHQANQTLNQLIMFVICIR